MQVWISAYARMRSRLVVVPLAPPYISFAIVSLTPYDALRGWHFVRFNFMVAKSCFATLAIVESALDSALAESKKSILHALRVSLTLAPLVVRSFGFKVEVSATAKAKCDRE